MIIPISNGIGPFYDSFFGEFGSSAGEVVTNVASDPGKAFDVATRPNRMSYYRMMLAPVAFLSLYTSSLGEQMWRGSGNLFKVCSLTALLLIVYFALRVANQEYASGRFKPLEHWLRERETRGRIDTVHSHHMPEAMGRAAVWLIVEAMYITSLALS